MGSETALKLPVIVDVVAAMAARGELAPQDPDLGADLFELTRARTAAAGLPAYEISNHARPGEESRHNLTYWRYGDYVGIGPGAHGRLTLDGSKWAHRLPGPRNEPAGGRWV